ncbi:MAG: hypothetical protein PHC83_04920 [Bacteroidales bacterium]|nr:hypothetical protein [Bacteroidales bacterium]MDD4209670.1 hypothetical protein [Bacteroidales bacterium]
MRKLSAMIVSLCFITFTLSSCDLFNTKKDFDKTLLPGKWQQGTLYERYYSNGDGITWDTSDDVTEEEALPFTWTLEEDDLIQIHILEMGGKVPKYYTVTALTTTNLTYHDDYGKSYSFTRVD